MLTEEEADRILRAVEWREERRRQRERFRVEDRRERRRAAKDEAREIGAQNLACLIECLEDLRPERDAMTADERGDSRFILAIGAGRLNRHLLQIKRERRLRAVRET